MYTELLTSISDLAVLGLNEETQGRFARAVNTIGLTAPQEVIEALLDFTAEIQVSKLDRTQDRHDQLLNTLLLRIRKSLDLPFTDDPETFRFRLLGGFPQKSVEDEARCI